MKLETVHKAMIKRAGDWKVKIDHKNNTISDAFFSNGEASVTNTPVRPMPPVTSPLFPDQPTPMASLNNTGKWNDYRPGELDWRSVLLDKLRKSYSTPEKGKRLADSLAEAEKFYLGSAWDKWPISKPNTQKPNPKAKKK